MRAVPSAAEELLYKTAQLCVESHAGLDHGAKVFSMTSLTNTWIF
jgi:hypothetical protein